MVRIVPATTQPRDTAMTLPLLLVVVVAVAAMICNPVHADCGGSPCVVLTACEPQQRWSIFTKQIDGATASNLALAAAQGANHVLSCPGTHSTTGGSDVCHLWSGTSFQADRNDILKLVGDPAGSFEVHSWPSTKSVPVGKGLLNPAMCLVQGPATASGASGVEMQPVKGGRCLQFRNTSGVLTANCSTAPLCLGISVPQPPCWHPNSSVHSAPMCDPTQPPDIRARDLVSRMTLAEKGHNMGGNGGWGGSAGVPRLGATSSCLAGQKSGILDSSEALHGLVQAGCGKSTYWAEFGGNNTGCPASFPHAQALGQTFNRTLFGLVGDQISTEARATWNIGKLSALWLWAPDINLFKDPRWGRGQEVAGEDPFLNGEYAMRWIHAFQYGYDGSATQYKAMPSAKHAFDYDLENWGGLNRASFNAIVSERDQVEYYFPAWRAAIEGGRVGSVMCSYNAVNGVPSCANGALLNGVLREAWGFDGLVVSDCGAIDHIHSEFKPGTPGTGTMQPGFPANNSDYTMLAAVSGGCDADCPGGAKPTQFFGGISHAVAAGVLPIEMVDRSLVRVFTAAIGLGLLDDPTKSPYAHLADKDLDTPTTRQLNLEASLQSMVLLKNEPLNGKPLLPLAQGSTLAIIGPHFNSTQDLLSDYSPGHWWARSPLMAAQAMADAGEIKLAGSAQGCDLEGNSTAGFAAALALAKKAGVVPIVFVGLSPNNDPSNSGTPPVTAHKSALESEGNDRTDINLQGQQEPLIKALYAANPKTVVVLIHGGALDISWSKSNVNAILDAHYPGQLGGDAILHTLLNYKGAAPAGRLTTTAYKQEFTTRPMSDMSLRNITYKHYTGEVCYPFGYGLSYSHFHVQWANSSSSGQVVGTDEMWTSHSDYFVARAKGDHVWASPASYSATIKNVGKIASDYVLLGFISSPGRIATDPAEPLRELFDFARVSLAPSASTTVHLSVPASVLSHVDVHGDERIMAGEYKIELGGEKLGDSVTLESTLTVTGAARMLFSMSEVRAKHG